MEEMITIPKWHMREIEDTLRMANNIHKSYEKRTCFDRCVCKAWEYAKSAMAKPSNDAKALPIPSVSVSFLSVGGAKFK